jgi:hypothetical protein
MDLPLKMRVFPADRGEAKSLSVLMGKLRSSRSWSNSAPTAPVAPRMATLTDFDKEKTSCGIFMDGLKTDKSNGDKTMKKIL